VDEVPSVALDLASIRNGIPALTPVLGGALAEAAAVCLASRGHDEICNVEVRWQSHMRRCTLLRFLVTESMRRAYRDMQEATELGASAIAILVIRELTEYTAVERSVKGTGFDYWLGVQAAANSNSEPLEHKARLEVSGILHGNQELVELRVREKVRQTRRTAGGYPAFIVVVEFGLPAVWMERDD